MRTKRLFVAVSGCVLLLGCRAEKDTDVGAASAYIDTVPSGVFCVRILVSHGDRLIDRRFDVRPGETAVLQLPRLPAGEVIFIGQAFGSPCSFVSDASIPTWLSDPTQAFLTPGQVTPVVLVLHRNADAIVGIIFDDERRDGGPGDGGRMDGGPFDFSRPDGGPIDMSRPPDLTRPVDLSRPPDLTQPVG